MKGCVPFLSLPPNSPSARDVQIKGANDEVSATWTFHQRHVSSLQENYGGSTRRPVVMAFTRLPSAGHQGMAGIKSH